MRLIVNGTAVEVAVKSGERLLAVLTDHLALTGTKFGCGHGECGACTVLVDGRLTYSCIQLAETCEGATITTIEGLTAPDLMSPLQRAFVAHDAAQCGYCTPGQIVAATHLLAHTPNPTDEQIREGMSGNLCRCGTYPRIMAAIQAVARGEFGDE